jgi:hypothetical protein
MPQDFALLPAAVRVVHGGSGRLTMAGRADIEVASNLVARAVTALVGLPAAGRDVPVTITFDRAPEAEAWDRRFAARRYRSRVAPGRGRDAGLLVERLGPFDNVFRLQATPAGLRWRLVDFRLLGIGLPAALRPACDAFEYADGEGRFVFDIAMDLPGFGRIIRYCGWLVPV